MFKLINFLIIEKVRVVHFYRYMMQKGYVFKTIAIFFSAILLVYGGFVTTTFLHKIKLPTSWGKVSDAIYVQTGSQPLSENFTQLEIMIKDGPRSEDGKIEEAHFNYEPIKLHAASNSGKRVSRFLQVKPGTYTISWKVKTNSKSFHKVTKYSKDIIISKQDLWIHVLIKGAQVTITN